MAHCGYVRILAFLGIALLIRGSLIFKNNNGKHRKARTGWLMKNSSRGSL